MFFSLCMLYVRFPLKLQNKKAPKIGSFLSYNVSIAFCILAIVSSLPMTSTMSNR